MSSAAEDLRLLADYVAAATQLSQLERNTPEEASVLDTIADLQAALCRLSPQDLRRKASIIEGQAPQPAQSVNSGPKPETLKWAQEILSQTTDRWQTTQQIIVRCNIPYTRFANALRYAEAQGWVVREKTKSRGIQARFKRGGGAK